MCGIVGVLGSGPVAGSIVNALKRLEYRGYDSAGVATLESGRLERRRAEGKLRNLEAKLAVAPLSGAIGIGHTRWATHGKPTESNAHPHVSRTLAVVHNGIIENFRALREELAAKGYRFETETDSEIAAFVVEDELARGKTPPEAVHAALKRMRGAFALVYLFEGEDDLLIGARQGAPLAIGYGEGETYLGSDALALAPFTDQVAYLDEGDWVVASRSNAEIRDASGKPVRRPIQRVAAGSLLAEKGNYRHFMAKEIHEQPEVVGHTLAQYVDMAATKLKPFAWPVDPKALTRVSIIGCGTAYVAGPNWKILDRALRAVASGDRRGFRISLPRSASRQEWADYRHFSVRRNGRHAGVPALRQGEWVEDRRCRQRADVEHRAPD
jgi:glucosamine--fructose-6-phosphate aminotransferase (isomerizing)